MKSEETYADVVTIRMLSPDERGMTLVEMIVAMCIFSFIVLGLCRLYGFAYNNWIDGFQEEHIQQQMQTVMGYMERDIKQAQYCAKYNMAVSVITTGPNANNEVIIYENVYNDGKLEQVHYLLSGNALKRSVVAPNSDGTYNNPAQWSTLLDGVYASPPLFTADQLTNGHPNLSIGIKLTVQNPARPTQPLVLSSTYAIRGNTGLQEANPNAV